MSESPSKMMSYVVYWDPEATPRYQIRGLPQGSTADDVVPEGRSIMGPYASRAEAQRAIKKDEEQHRWRWKR